MHWCPQQGSHMRFLTVTGTPLCLNPCVVMEGGIPFLLPTLPECSVCDPCGHRGTSFLFCSISQHLTKDITKDTIFTVPSPQCSGCQGSRESTPRCSQGIIPSEGHTSVVGLHPSAFRSQEFCSSVPGASLQPCGWQDGTPDRPSSLPFLHTLAAFPEPPVLRPLPSAT